MGKLPDRWVPYKPLGVPVKGTQFIAFKVPLSKNFNNKLNPEERFSPENLLEMCPNLSLVVDLTNTNRYYNKNEFTRKKVHYEKIFCPGHEIPDFSIVRKFFNIVDSFLEQAKSDDLIGVHCTHGVNRTGYFICRYMIQRLGVNPDVAISEFAAARGHPIERVNYIEDLGRELKEVPPLGKDDVQKFVFDSQNEELDITDNEKGRKGIKRPYDDTEYNDGRERHRRRWRTERSNELIDDPIGRNLNASQGYRRSNQQGHYRSSGSISSSSTYRGRLSHRPAPYDKYNRRGLSNEIIDSQYDRNDRNTSVTAPHSSNYNRRGLSFRSNDVRSGQNDRIRNNYNERFTSDSYKMNQFPYNRSKYHWSPGAGKGQEKSVVASDQNLH